MEPGRDDREEAWAATWPISSTIRPQWSPVVMTGRSPIVKWIARSDAFAAMEPGRDDREEFDDIAATYDYVDAAMEPGRDDREEPVRPLRPLRHALAAMEPGRDDREEVAPARRPPSTRFAAMEPGRDDREEELLTEAGRAGRKRRNGARS